MKIKTLVMLTITLILISCDKIPTKSINEALTKTELKKAVQKDKKFQDFYDSCVLNFYNLQLNEINDYNNITYDRMFNYYNFINDTLLMKNYKNKLINHYDKNNEIYQLKIDSVVKYWEEQVELNNLEKLVKIELVDIKKEYSTYSNYLRNVYLGFKVTPLQGVIDQIRFSYNYKAKIKSEYSNNSWCILTETINKPQVFYFKVSFLEEDLFKPHNLKTFLNNYDIKFIVDVIRRNNENIYSIELPKEISNYIDKKEDEFYKDELIRNLINDTYLTKSEFILKEMLLYQRNFDVECFELYTLLKYSDIYEYILKLTTNQ